MTTLLSLTIAFIFLPVKENLLDILKVKSIGTMPNHYLEKGYIFRGERKWHNFATSNNIASRWITSATLTQASIATGSESKSGE
jgi:HKD family nuclease